MVWLTSPSTTSVSSDDDALVALSNAGIELAGTTKFYMVEFFPWRELEPGHSLLDDGNQGL